MAALIEYGRVEISLGEKAVVHDISFTVSPGEILGLVGESGSGKTTIIRAAMGLLGNTGQVTKGDIYFAGKNIPDMPESELRHLRGAKIGMIFQDSSASLCPIRTVGEQIVESVAAHEKVAVAQVKAAAMEMFKNLRFKDGERLWTSCPFELSGGECQRVSIALALLLKPDLLLADEPTSALDVAIQRYVLREMRRMREACGTAIVLVTHDMGVVAAMADTVLVLQDGKIMEYGKTAEVLAKPQSAYTKKLLAAVPRLRRA